MFEYAPACPYCEKTVAHLLDCQEVFYSDWGFEVECEHCGQELYANSKVDIKFTLDKIEE